MNIFSFGLSAVISKVTVADFEHVFVCWAMYTKTTVVLRILEVLYPASKYLKSTTEALKQDVKSVKKLTVETAFFY